MNRARALAGQRKRQYTLPRADRILVALAANRIQVIDLIVVICC
jgi:hypothetical protein